MNVREHGIMSDAYRRKFRMHGRPVPHIAMDSVIMNARGKFDLETILRNGPRILRACKTMHWELTREVHP